MRASEPRAGQSDNCRMCGFGTLRDDGPGRAAEPGQRRTPRTTRDSGHQPAAHAAGPAPWEGLLVSETIDLYSGSTGEPEESPSLARSGVAQQAGTSPAQAGAVRSWPDADDGTGTGGADTAVKSAAARRSGTGLSAMVLPDLQRLAQSLGLTGTARLRKGDLIAAIQERQRGSSAGGGSRSGDDAGSAAASQAGPDPAGDGEDRN